MSDAERIKFWTRHAIGSEADREYLAASAQAQISIALSLERIAEALEFDDDEVSLAAVDASVKEYYAERLAESPLGPELAKAGMIESPVGDVRAAALEIEANIAYLEDKAAQESITNEIETIITKHVKDWISTKELERLRQYRETFGGPPSPPPSPVGDVPPPDPVAANPSDGVCNRCGWEKEHMAHHFQYGSHKYEPSPYKDLTEWRKANNVSQVLPNVE